VTAARRTRPGTTVDELYTVLRERIIDGTYAPSLRMSQEELAAELAVSRTPLRQALQRLEADGLLVATANRGMHVAPIANSDTEQHYALRLLVEPPTLSAILDQITDADLDAMAVALADMTRVADRTRDFQEAHREFHAVALRRYPRMIGELTDTLHTMIYRHQRVYFSRPRTPEDVINTDALFLDAIQRRDVAAVRQLLEFHLLDAAVGLALDFNADHEFGALILTLRGLGIDIEHDPDGHIVRPARVRWLRKDAASMPALSTSSLSYAPNRNRKS
jgi:DNA-binding GntR family transcriptional regulator